MSSYDSRNGSDRLGGSDAAISAQAQAVGGVQTALSLILLTFFVYLFSLTNLDEARQHSVYASLAKAFMFTERSQQVVEKSAKTQLLSGARQGVRELAGYLAAIGHPDILSWEDGDLVVTLPNGGNVGESSSELLLHLGHLAVITESMVRVESYAAEAGEVRLVGKALARSVAVASSIGSLSTQLDQERLSALGFKVPFPLPNGLEAEGVWVRVVLEGVEVLL